MKRLLFSFLVICFASGAYAQADTSLIYLRFPTVPPFKITRVPDSSFFSKEDLNKKRATIIMIFSPDCDHCQHETRELIANISLFKKVQIIMASPLNFADISKFYTEYGIAGYPNIIMGRDPGYFFGTFYHIRSFPAIFLYDKKGKFVQSFDGSVPVERIAAAL